MHGIKALSFESSPVCRPYFERLCDLNNVKGNLEQIPLGECAVRLELRFPGHSPWLGTVMGRGEWALRTDHEEVVTVEQRRLDDYLPLLKEHSNIVVKMDVEGAELGVLAGAVQFLEVKKPMVFFECVGAENRSRISERFLELGYMIGKVPWPQSAVLRYDGVEQFQMAKGEDFVACPNT